MFTALIMLKPFPIPQPPRTSPAPCFFPPQARWQNDMHLKLSKLSMMCKELNDESAKRKEDSTSLRSDLSRVRAERNALSSDMDTLCARLSLYEKEGIQNDSIHAALSDVESSALDRADDAIERRDSVIDELSSRLRSTVETLEIERHQQRQRRQIIFPKSKSISLNNHTAQTATFFDRSGTPPLAEGEGWFAPDPGGGAHRFPSSPAQQEAHEAFFLTGGHSHHQLAGRVKGVVRGDPSQLDVAGAEALRREAALQARCEELERELWTVRENL